jgi:hypothetical protein
MPSWNEKEFLTTDFPDFTDGKRISRAENAKIAEKNLFPFLCALRDSAREQSGLKWIANAWGGNVATALQTCPPARENTRVYQVRTDTRTDG